MPLSKLSGGERAKVALARQLVGLGEIDVFFLDEPTTGLHFHDVARLLDVLARLRDANNTLLVIEHNMDVIKRADWIVDMGPEGGEAGGTIVAQGPPEKIAQESSSYTGQFLKKELDQ